MPRDLVKFENAMLRFLACVAVSVVAASVIGRLLD